MGSNTAACAVPTEFPWIGRLCNMRFSLIFMALLLAFSPTLVTGESCKTVWEMMCRQVPRRVCVRGHDPNGDGTSSFRGKRASGVICSTVYDEECKNVPSQVCGSTSNVHD